MNVPEERPARSDVERQLVSPARVQDAIGRRSQQLERQTRRSCLPVWPVVGSSPSAIKSSLSSGSSRYSEIELLVSRSTSDAVHDLAGMGRWVSASFAPVTTDLYAGVKVYHRCPSARQKCGAKKYGWSKSRRRPRSRDDHRPCAPADRAPPRNSRDDTRRQRAPFPRSVADAAVDALVPPSATVTRVLTSGSCFSGSSDSMFTN